MRTIIVIYFAAASILSAGCGLAMEPVDEEIEAAIAEIGNSTRYALDESDRTYSQFGPAPHTMWNCDQYAYGVASSWHLIERNKFDFRSSYHACRNIEPDGEQSPGHDSQFHFSHEGNGMPGNALTPLTDLPVGVRLRYKTNLFLNTPPKISDVAMLHDHADDIFNHFHGYQEADYAFGHSGDTRSVVCPPGKVMTGIGVHEDNTAGGNNQTEIRGVEIRCDELIIVPF